MGDPSHNPDPPSATNEPVRGDGRPLTHEQALAWLTRCAVALVVAALTFGNSVVSRAEAAAQVQISPLQKTIDRVEGKVDRILERLGAGVKP